MVSTVVLRRDQLHGKLALRVFRGNRFLDRRLRDRHFSASAAVTLAGRITARVIFSVANDKRTIQTAPLDRYTRNRIKSTEGGPRPARATSMEATRHDDTRSGCGSESARHQVFPDFLHRL